MRKAELYTYFTDGETGSEKLSNFSSTTQLGNDGVRTQKLALLLQSLWSQPLCWCQVPGTQQGHRKCTFLFSDKGILEQFPITYPLFLG